MELRICVLVLLVGCLTVSEGKSPLQVLDEEISMKQGSQYEQFDEEAVNTNEKLKDGPPTFYSESFGSNITGKTMQTLHDRTIYAFQGFRYGIGPRFKPPTAVDKFWSTDNFEAIHIGYKCPQGATVGKQAAGSEDCLFLNVYTPYIPSDNKELLPVIFFIHGGAFILGSSTTYMPTRLLDHEVILVTIHYRMGAFGFFTLNNEDAPGNIALYDMVEALNWVQRHIEDFGGNKSEVTVMGESAGSVSANFMMIVEPAQGLFRAVISESGSCLDPWSWDKDPLYAAHYNAEFAGCPTDNDEDLLNCMLEADMDTLVKAQGNLTITDQRNGLDGFRGISPTVQNFPLNPDAGYKLIFDEPAKNYFLKNRFSKVPFMTGANKQEGSLIVSVVYYNYILFHHLGNNVTYMREQIVTDILRSIGIEDDSHSLSVSLQNYYCPDVDLANMVEAGPCLIDMTGALYLKAGSWQVANYHSYFSDEPTFYYSFEFKSDDSLSNIMNLPFDGGVTHADELIYLFSLPAVMDYPDQMATEERMTKMWTNFAIYLNPTPEDQKDELAEMGIPIWTPFKFEDHHVMVIANNLTIDTEFSKRWTISLDELRANETKCTGLCVDYRDERDEALEEKAVVEEERDEALKDKDEAEDERDQAEKDKVEAEDDRDQAVSEKEDAEKDRDEYKGERDDYQEKMYEYLDDLTETKKESEKFEDQKMPFEISMIVFIVLTVIASGIAIYFIIMRKR